MNPRQYVIINTLRTVYSDAFQPEGTAVDNDFYEEIRLLENQIRVLNDPSDKEIEKLASEWRSQVDSSILRRLERDQYALKQIESQLERQLNLSPIPTTYVQSSKSWAQIKAERNLQQQTESVPTTYVQSSKSWAQIKAERNLQQQTESVPTTYVQSTKSWAQMKEERRLEEEQSQSSSSRLPQDTKSWREMQQQQRLQQYPSASFQTSPEIVKEIEHTYEQYLSTKGNDGLSAWLKPVVKESVDGSTNIQMRFFSMDDHNKFIAKLVNQQQSKNVNMIVRGHDNEIIAAVTNGEVDMDEQLGSTVNDTIRPS